jgi:hypothetical protein
MNLVVETQAYNKLMKNLELFQPGKFISLPGFFRFVKKAVELIF